MQFHGNIKVVPELPTEISRLKELAYNLYFSWNPNARQLFRKINPRLWTQINHNPVKFLTEVQQKELRRCATDPAYMATYKNVLKEFDDYMGSEKTWFRQNFPQLKDKVIAYFSAELGFHESLPIYSGGLGVLAGDHLKTASDLGIPLVGISLFYYQSYFTQQIDAQGNQIALYPPQIPEELPLLPATDAEGKPLTLSVSIKSREVKVRVWKVQVGRISAFLLDANLPENAREDRLITSRLYGGDEEMRISQEIILGMGGVLALRAMGIEPAAWHMNEGHSVFLALERMRALILEHGLAFEEALEAVAANTIFTTHTPVPAGNDAFPLHYVDDFFQNYWQSIGARRYQFMELGSQVQPEGYEIFNLTILSLKLSKFRNGVSRLHGEVSRKLWNDVWQNLPTDEVPILHITNGVHAHTWTVYRMQLLFDTYLGPEWREHLDDPVFWKSVFSIPDAELWKTKLALKEKMLNHLRERLAAQLIRNKVGTLRINRLNELLKPEALTIGFARRFATYKRGTLIFKDKERLRRMLNDPARPVQLIFAGKAHPKDAGGQQFIREINQVAMEEGFRGKVFFIENYDIGLARDLVSGVDVWLNNPRRPQEASGTSGQKVALNGGINFSVLDGWWCEGYNGKNGFAFGDREDYHSLEQLDEWDSDAIYDILENDIIPQYYQRNEEGLPAEWIKTIKNSLASLFPAFNTHRMLKEYMNLMYLPAVNLGEQFGGDQFAFAKEYAAWVARIARCWPQVSLELDGDQRPESDITLRYDQPLDLRVKVNLGELEPAEVKLQVYLFHESATPTDDSGQYEVIDMTKVKKAGDHSYIYQAQIRPADSGNYKYTVRAMACHARLPNHVERGMVRWLHEA